MTRSDSTRLILGSKPPLPRRYASSMRRVSGRRARLSLRLYVLPTGSGGRVLGQPAVGRAQALDRAVDLVTLSLEMANLIDDLLRLQLLFEIGRFVYPLAANQIVDLGEREA